jgi:DNA polymerase elongation subunit (family B)
MFQSIFVNRERTGEDAYKIYIRDDNSGIKEYPNYFPTVYKFNPDGEYFTLFGDRCSPLPPGKYDRTDPTIYEKDLSKDLALLRDLYHHSEEAPKWHNIVYLDIEQEILGALTPENIRLAEAEITSIALSDITNKQKYCFILDKQQQLQSTHQDNKHVISCSSEKQLLNQFLLKWQEIDPTIVVHFNGDFYDIPCLYYRIKRVLGDKVYRLSPIGKIEENIYNPMSPITIGLVNSLDFMLLFKKYITKVEPSYKLNDIGIKYANLGKIEYNGSLDRLFKEDINKFIDYNMRDIEILEKIEEKLGFVALTIQISHLCRTPYESIYYNTILNEGAILSYLKQNNIVAPNKPTTTNPSIKEFEIGDEVVNQRGTSTIEGVVFSINGDTIMVRTKAGAFIPRSPRTLKKKEGFNGGFLLDIKPDLYRWAIDMDASSFYPSSIRSLNLGIETLIARIVIPDPTKELWCSMVELKEKDPNEILVIEKLNRKTYMFTQTEIKVGDLIDFIEKNNWNITANGVVYRTDKQGVSSKILTEWFGMRKEYKKKMAQAYDDGNMELYAFYDRMQQAFKILLNSHFGAFAINSWRFTDGYKIISSSITCSCQRLLIESINEINHVIDDEYLI